MADDHAQAPARSQDVNPTSSVEPLSDKPLRRDIRMLGFELGHILRTHAGDELFNLVEEVRALSKARRSGDAAAESKLRQRLSGLTAAQTEQVIRALSCFFDLTNLAEDRHRVRVLRYREAISHPAPLRESIAAAVEVLKADGFTAADMQGLLDRLNIELVFTAHPTEAKRRTIRNTLRRLRRDLAHFDREDTLPRERDRAIERLRTDLSVLWETDTVRPRKPTVLEEVRRGLYVAEELWDVLPPIYRTMRTALKLAWPEQTWRMPAFLRFGSWIGGDRDGNPFVTASVTAETLKLFRQRAIMKHLAECDRQQEIVSISTRRRPVSAAMHRAIEQAMQRWPQLGPIIDPVSPHETYRRFLRVIRFRLHQTYAAELVGEAHDAAYTEAAALRADVESIMESLRGSGLSDLAEGRIRDWMDAIDAFGFHLASLDIREDSRRLHEAIGELMAQMGVAGDYAARDEAGKVALLTAPVTIEAAERINAASLGEAAGQTLELFKLIHRVERRWGSGAIGALIISMTHHASDALTMLWLSRVGAAACGETDPVHLPIVPLFETIDDLRRAEDILEALLNNAEYRRHVKACGNRQICMIGYSDSTKDGGYLTSNWELYQGQGRMTAATARHGVELMLFHGRGGALGRGGGPAARGILSLPPAAVKGRIRITEQGEVMAERYDDPHIAARHLEQVTWATMLVTARAADAPKPSWVELMTQASQRAYATYRRLVEDEGFVDYFSEATPIRSIETLPIGSRPARRRGQRTITDLRAIPYTFAWTQNRQMITAFFGLGAGLEAAVTTRLEELRDMYARWPFFRAVIDNAELALAKSDKSIGAAYARLMRDGQVSGRIWSVIESEHQRATQAVLAITGKSELLEATPWLRKSIDARNPYVDPLNLIQIDLLRRAAEMPASAEGSPQAMELEELLRLSVQGVAAGMRTTG